MGCKYRCRLRKTWEWCNWALRTTSLSDNFASIIRDYCQIKVSLRFKLLVKFTGNISAREDAIKLYFCASVQYPISSSSLLLPVYHPIRMRCLTSTHTWVSDTFLLLFLQLQLGKFCKPKLFQQWPPHLCYNKKYKLAKIQETYHIHLLQY